jgi:hypothetical protein
MPHRSHGLRYLSQQGALRYPGHGAGLAKPLLRGTAQQ